MIGDYCHKSLFFTSPVDLEFPIPKWVFYIREENN
jgi:hypothetical protein